MDRCKQAHMEWSYKHAEVIFIASSSLNVRCSLELFVLNACVVETTQKTSISCNAYLPQPQQTKS